MPLLRLFRRCMMFDNIAQQYDKHAIVSQKLAEGLFSRLDFIKMNPQSILDLGTGTGAALPELLSRYPDAQITAIDKSEQMLALAQSKVEDARVTWVCADFFENPLPGQTFDLIFANDILPWVDSIAGFFQRCLAALNPEGLLLFSGLGVDTLKELKRANDVSKAGLQINSYYDIHDLGDALVHLGYSDPVLDLQYLKLTYQTVNHLFNELKCSGMDLALPTKELHAAYEQTHEGRYPATFELVFGHARRGEMIIRRHTPGEPIHIPLSDIKRRRV